VSNNKLLPPGKRILIVDDHKMMREALRSLLEERLGYECVAEANDGYEAVKKVKEFRPDIVMMDITLPNINGIEATRLIKSEQSDIKVVVLSMHATPVVGDDIAALQEQSRKIGFVGAETN
jgi:two-component system, NarL family, response regulator DegU